MTDLENKIKECYETLKDNDRKFAEIKRKKEICGAEYNAVYDDITARNFAKRCQLFATDRK